MNSSLIVQPSISFLAVQGYSSSLHDYILFTVHCGTAWALSPVLDTVQLHDFPVLSLLCSRFYKMKQPGAVVFVVVNLPIVMFCLYECENIDHR